MNNKICFYSVPFPKVKSYFDMIDVSVEYGFDCIEGFNMFEFLTPDITVAPKIKQYADSKGVKFVCFSANANLAGDDYLNQIETLKGYVDVAKVLGAQYFQHTIINEYKNPDNVLPYKEKLFKRGIEAVREIYDYCQKCGIKAIYEEQGYIFNGIEGYGKFLSEVNRNIGVLADFANLCQTGDKIEDFIEAFSEKIVHVHIKDAVICCDSGTNGFKTLCGNYMISSVVGEGDVNIEKGIELLKKAGYNGCYGIEFGSATNDKGVMDKVVNYIKNIK